MSSRRLRDATRERIILIRENSENKQAVTRPNLHSQRSLFSHLYKLK